MYNLLSWLLDERFSTWFSPLELNTILDSQLSLPKYNKGLLAFSVVHFDIKPRNVLN